MRVMVGVGHPKHVHFWKNIIRNLENNGHEVKIVAKAKDITLYLLDVYGFDYKVVGKNYNGLAKKAYGLIENDLRSLKIAREFKPDILAMGTPYLAQVSTIIRRPHIALLDTEHATHAYQLTRPFTDVICTPSCLKRKINPRKHMPFDGYLELAYLHPNYFKPDQTVLEDLELSKDEKFIVLRFVSWSASHDVGQHGFIDGQEMVNKLEDYGVVFITSEQKLSKFYEKYRINVPPERMHDLLYHATMYVGEGAAMASEAAILGTPAIYVNTLRLGYLDEEEKEYQLVYNFSNPKIAQEQAFNKAVELLEDDNLKDKWKKKREKLLSEKIDVTKFMTELIENYPTSLEELKDNNSMRGAYGKDIIKNRK